MVVTGDSDAVVVGELTLWLVVSFGVMALILGSSLFALATWLTREPVARRVGTARDRRAARGPCRNGHRGRLLSDARRRRLVLLVTLVTFPLGWVAVAISALRVGRPFAAASGAAA